MKLTLSLVVFISVLIAWACLKVSSDADDIAGYDDEN